MPPVEDPVERLLATIDALEQDCTTQGCIDSTQCAAHIEGMMAALAVITGQPAPALP
jgi:hypothetical protein